MTPPSPTRTIPLATLLPRRRDTPVPMTPMELRAPSDVDVYTSLDELIAATNEHAATQGYAGRKGGNKKNVAGDVQKQWTLCDTSGKYKG